jgi:hypothetical protein
VATFTVTTAQNIDELASKAGNDTYNVNGGFLTVDQDSRYGLNQTTSAILGAMTLSATLGGTVEFNATKVRLIPYDAGGGNVPALNTSITGAAGSGKLIAVYATLTSAPTAVASPMPAAGFIKIKQWNDGAYVDNEALGGLTATVDGTDRVGWIEIVGGDTRSVTVNRLSTFRVRGEWYDLGTTDGARATTYQMPTNGSTVNYFPGVWVETAASSGVYEFYPCAGSAAALITVFATDEFRGRVCWVTTSTGEVRFGHDGANLTGGFIPETGRKIRVPNIFFVNATLAAPTVNVLPAASLGNRYEFNTSGGGVLDIDKVLCNWYLNILQAYSVTLSHVGVMTALVANETATFSVWSHVGVGQEAANTQNGLTLGRTFAGGTLTDCVWTRANASTGMVLTDAGGFTFVRVRTHTFGSIRSSSSGSMSCTRVKDCTWEDCTYIGGRVLLTTCFDLAFTDTHYADNTRGNTISTQVQYMFDCASGTKGVTLDGADFAGLLLTQPYSGILRVASGSEAIKLRNIGTAAEPQSLGSAQRDLVAWTRVTTTATVTSVAHGLETGNYVYAVYSNSIAAIIVGNKQVTVTDANTFTFTCLNAGAASGTISYWGVMSSNLFVVSNASSAKNIRVQRCYTQHTRSTNSFFTVDNSSRGLVLENVPNAFSSLFVTSALNMSIRGGSGTSALTAQTSVYGTHWLDWLSGSVTPNVAAQSWTRATTTATVTSTGHGIRTGRQVLVTVTSDVAAIVLGLKTITADDANTFTFTCLNAGAASGTLTFVPLVAQMALMMNEETAETASQVTIESGTPGFTSRGNLSMPTIGDRVMFEQPDYVIGHTGFPIAEPVMAGGVTNNHDLKYAIDLNDGAGFSAYKNLRYTRLGGGGSAASTTVTMTSTTGVADNDYIFGTGVAPLAYVVSVDSGTDITVSAVNTATVSGTLRFCQLPSQTGIDAELGFKLRATIETVVTSTSAINSLYWFTTTTDVSRAYQYPLDLAPVVVKVYDAVTGAPIEDVRIRLEAAAGGPATPGDLILTGTTNVSGVLSGVVSFVGDQPVSGRVRRATAGLGTRYKAGIISATITLDGMDVTALLISDE